MMSLTLISLIDYVNKVGFAQQGQEKGLRYSPAGALQEPRRVKKKFFSAPQCLTYYYSTKNLKNMLFSVYLKGFLLLKIKD